MHSEGSELIWKSGENITVVTRGSEDGAVSGSAKCSRRMIIKVTRLMLCYIFESQNAILSSSNLVTVKLWSLGVRIMNI